MQRTSTGRGLQAVAPRLPSPYLPSPRFPSLTSPAQDLAKRASQTISEAFAGVPEVPMVDWYPAVNLSENRDEFLVTAELAGLNRTDVTIDFSDGVLSIRGEKKAPEIRGNGGRQVHLSERPFGVFERSFTLPRGIAESGIVAEFTDGLLTVRVPKSEEMKARRRQIPITVK